MSDNIILFPDFQRLKEEVDKLRAELSMLILERDELRLVECRNIEMIYMLKLGNLEYRAFETQCIYLRLKRKVELIQAKKNRQEKIVLTQIEDILDAEFAEFKRKLDEQISRMNDAIKRSQCDVLSDQEAKELKKIYHEIIKALHPDLNPNLTPSQLDLFNNAVNAYENGDLDTLRVIHVMISKPILSDKHENAMIQLAKEKERLVKAIKTVKESIEKIKSEFPYTVKELIRDPEKIAARRKELENIISQYEKAIAVYKARIEEMLG